MEEEELKIKINLALSVFAQTSFQISVSQIYKVRAQWNPQANYKHNISLLCWQLSEVLEN